MKVLVKVLFSDNWMELIDTWNINRYICKVLHNSDLLIVRQILLDIKIHQSITLLLIFNHLSHVQLCLVLKHWKSGFNAVCAYPLCVMSFTPKRMSRSKQTKYGTLFRTKLTTNGNIRNKIPFLEILIWLTREGLYGRFDHVTTIFISPYTSKNGILFVN